MYPFICNTPINLADENGNWPKWLKCVVVGVVAVAAVAAIATVNVATGGSLGVVLIGAAVGAGISGAVSAGTQLAQTGTIDIFSVLTDMAIGAVGGALGASSFGSLVKPFFSGALGFSGSVASDWVSGKEIDWGKAAFAGALGFVLRMGGGAQHGQKATKNMVSQTKLKNFVKAGKKTGTNHHQRLIKAANKSLSEVFKEGKKSVFKNMPGDLLKEIFQKVDILLFG